MKRIVSIQDISCLGKCSLTVALPVISAMGVECTVVPTALLSAHTAFDGFQSFDLSDKLDAIADHWQSLGVHFDAIYTGYLANEAQVDWVCRFIDRFHSAQTLIFVDPAMADHGKLYSGLAPDFPKVMKRLCEKADVIAPNITEACLMTDTPYRTDFSQAELLSLCRALGNTILTGVEFEGNRIGVLTEQGSCAVQKLENLSPGTGDLFASCCVGAMTRGGDLMQAASLAVDFVAKCIMASQHDAVWYGTNFEHALPYLIERVGKEFGYEKTI